MQTNIDISAEILTLIYGRDYNTSMPKGRVRTYKKCPKCDQDFQYLSFEQGIVCIPCKTVPKSFYLYVRDFGFKKFGYPDRLYTSPRGKRFGYFPDAQDQLDDMRKQEPFIHEDWLPGASLAFTIKSLITEEEKSNKKKNPHIIQDWLNVYKADVKNMNKVNEYVRHVEQYMKDHIIPHLNGMDIRHIKKPHIDKLKGELIIKGLSHKSIKNVLGTLHAFLKDHLEIIKAMPLFPEVKSIPKRQRRWMDIETQMKVIEKVPDRHRLIFELMRETSLRQGQVRALKKKCLIDGDIISFSAFSGADLIPVTKNFKNESHKLSYGLYRKLQQYVKEKRPEDWMFDINGKQYGEERIRKIWRNACKDADIEYVPPHMAFRNSAASQIMEEYKAKARSEIMQKLGHTNIKTGEQVYVLDRSKKI